MGFYVAYPLSSIGPLNRFINSPTVPKTFVSGAGTKTGKGDEGSLASFKLVLDPRFQFETALLYKDFGMPSEMK
ncbi:MAG: hypothetical protein FJ116_08720 [Deltaproteobacteria bacterium]|nr:hypothetical protein [Deltaproteobacteria bacterium]